MEMLVALVNIDNGDVLKTAKFGVRVGVPTKEGMRNVLAVLAAVPPFKETKTTVSDRCSTPIQSHARPRRDGSMGSYADRRILLGVLMAE